MDEVMRISELKLKVKQFCEERDWDKFHGAKDLAIGISTEAAELLEHFRFRSDSEVEALFSDPMKKEAISEEMADIFYFLIRMAQRYDIDLAISLEKKIMRNAEKYPLHYAKGSNKKYTEFSS